MIRAQAIPLPDSLFWYTLCMCLTAFAIWAIKRHIDSNKDTSDRHADLIAQMSKCLIELTTMTKVHDVQIQSVIKKVDDQGDELEALRDFYIVTYKKK